MAVVLLSPILNGWQGLGTSLVLLNGGFLNTYQAGTSTPLATYTTNAGSVANSNPIVLGSDGRPPNEIWLISGSAYRFVLFDSSSNLIATYDNIVGIPGIGTLFQWAGSAGGTSDALALTPSPAITGYVLGASYTFVATATNTTTTPTAAISGLAPKTLVKSNNKPPSAGDIVSGKMYTVVDNGSNLVIQNTLPSDLPSLYSQRNRLINGECNIAQGTVPTLSTSPQFAQVDMVTGWASSGAVTAGTITQALTGSPGRNYCVQFTATTLTGAGQLSWRYRVESKDATSLNNQKCTFQIKVRQDSGSAINHTIIIRTPLVVDSYGGTSVVATSSAISVASLSTQTLTFTFTASAVQNGIEIEIQAACGATTLNWSLSEWQLEEGIFASPFEYTNMEVSLAKCQRYYEKSFPQGTIPAQNAGFQSYGFTQVVAAAATMRGIPYRYSVTKRVAPAVTLYNTAAANAQARNATVATDCTATTAGGLTDTGFFLTTTMAAGSSIGDSNVVHFTADARL
jgi:hypothetical protein